MSFSRRMLKALGISDEAVEQIIEEHISVVDSLKAERDSFKEAAEKLPGVQKELDTLKADGGSWQTKYQKEHDAFEAYKNEQTLKETEAAKGEAYKALLAEAGISEKRIPSILKVTDLKNIELGDDGKIKDAENHIKDIKTEWADFVTKTTTVGASTPNPSNATGGTVKYSSKEEIYKITDPATRQKAIAENRELFGI